MLLITVHPTGPPPTGLPPTKPGRCPAPMRGAGICIQECNNDEGCSGNRKCCFNGCGHVCLDPIFDDQEGLFSVYYNSLAANKTISDEFAC